MSNFQREEEILNLLRECGHASVEHLAKELHASPSSIRRDLTVLQEKGLAKRSHGGAAFMDGEPGTTPFAFRLNENRREKQSIVKAASRLIKENTSIYIDSSTTALSLYRYLNPEMNVTVFSNNLQLVQILAAKGVETYCVGGKLSRHNRVITTGNFALEMLKNIYVDMFFFSASALSKEGVITDVDEDETVIRRLMLAHANQKVFLHHKERFAHTSRFLVGQLNDMDYLVTDQKEEELKSLLGETNIIYAE